MVFADALVCSSRCFSQGSWPGLTRAEAKYHHAMATAVYRAAAGKKFATKENGELDIDAYPEAEDEALLAK
eukprot:3464589-Pyramimonas_sp.AAC.1